jgi:hypothetical protein
MKIYVAARLHDKERVLDLHTKLRELGHEISHDWTTHQNIKPYLNNLELAKSYAALDIQGVSSADIFVLLTHAEIGAGSSGELGAAIALNVALGKPEVFVVGEHSENNLFYYHPIVTRLTYPAELLAILAKEDNLLKVM